VADLGVEKMNLELSLLNKRNNFLSDKCVESYKPVKQLEVEFRDYEPPGVQIKGTITGYDS